MMDGMKCKGTVAAFADYVQYSPTLWYRWFYNTVYSRATDFNQSSPLFLKFSFHGIIGPRYTTWGSR